MQHFHGHSSTVGCIPVSVSQLDSNYGYSLYLYSLPDQLLNPYYCLPWYKSDKNLEQGITEAEPLEARKSCDHLDHPNKPENLITLTLT